MSELIIYSLFVFRISLLLTEESGIGNIVKNLREFINANIGDWSPLKCFSCTSMATSLLIFILIESVSFVDAIAISGLSIIVFSIFERIDI